MNDVTAEERQDPAEDVALHRLARVERNERAMEALQRAVASLQASRDASRKVLWLVIPALVGALATVLVFAAEKIAASSERAGEIRATLDSEKDRRQTLEREVEQLRAVLLRLGAGEPHKPTSTDDALPPPPDKFSLSPQRRDGHGGGAALAASGRVLLQTPKLQNGHDRIVPTLHSMFELHVRPHEVRGWMCGDEAQAKRARQATATILSIPEM